MEKEKYAKLFKEIVGRDLTPEEFLKAKASDFDPKQLKAVAGLTVDADSDLTSESLDSPAPVTQAEVGATEDETQAEAASDEKTEDTVVTAPTDTETGLETAETPEVTSENPEKSQSGRKVPTKLIVALVAVLLVLIGGFVFIKTRPVNVSNVVEVKFSGYDSYGRASYNDEKVYNELAEKLAVKAGFSKAEAKSLINTQTNAISNLLTDAKYRSKAEKLLKWTSQIKFTFDPKSNLKNGDKVSFKLKPGKDVPVKAIDKTFTVKGLKKTQKVSAESLSKGAITFSGYNGNGRVEFDDSKFELVSNKQSGSLSNGDELKFEFNQSYLDNLLTKGKAVTEESFKVTVSDLKDMSDISKVDTLYAKIPELIKSDYQDKPAGEYGSYDLTYKIEPQKSFIKVSDDTYDNETQLSLVITYKITKTQTWVKDDTWDNKKKGDVETKEIYTYQGYQNVAVYKEALVLSNLQETSGASWMDFYDIDAVYASLEKSGYGEYQPKS